MIRYFDLVVILSGASTRDPIVDLPIATTRVADGPHARVRACAELLPAAPSANWPIVVDTIAQLRALGYTRIGYDTWYVREVPPPA